MGRRPSGAVGAFGVAVALAQARREQWSPEELSTQVRRVKDARPTAVNLAWGVDRALPLIDQGLRAVVAEGRLLMAEDLEANRILSGHGADWIVKAVGGGAHEPVRVLTHCNAGALATTGWGTALGVVRELHERGTLGRVYANETWPLLQGARLTVWELARLGIDHVVQVDAAAASTIVGGRVDVAVVGADRIAANGDAANKIGTLGVALAWWTRDPFRGGRADVHGRRRDGNGPRTSRSSSETTPKWSCLGAAASDGAEGPRTSFNWPSTSPPTSLVRRDGHRRRVVVEPRAPASKSYVIERRSSR